MRTVCVAIVSFWITVFAGAGAAFADEALCADPSAVCGATLSAECLRLGAGVVSAECGEAAVRYRDCLADVAARCEVRAPAPTEASSTCSRDEAEALWAIAERDDSCHGYQAFIRACPESRLALFADGRRKTLSCDVAAPGPERAEAVSPPSDRTALHRALQVELRRLGFYRSSVDGAWGPRSRAALSAFQGVDGDGEASEEALIALRARPDPAPAPSRSSARTQAAVETATPTLKGVCGARPSHVRTRQPAHYSLGRLEEIFVDDRSCPAGQIVKITGGWPSRNIPRRVECVPMAEACQRP